MTHATALADPRFSVQKVSRQEWIQATAANLAADYLAGYAELTREFARSRTEPEFRALSSLFERGDRREVQELVEATRSQSLVFLVLMATGGCNADCPICFTDRRRKPNELDPEARDRLLEEARALGARFVYVPGEGEPTIDPGFWRILETCRRLGLHAIVFTNGILFSDLASCRKYWECDPEVAVARLAEYPVSLYHKLWTTRSSQLAEMMAIPERLCQYSRVDGVDIPVGLARLMEALPRERVGIEVVVERRNADEVVETIVPFAESHGLARIVEMLQHNGRLLGDGSYDPTPLQAARAERFLSPTSCAMASCKAVVTTSGFLAPRIAWLEHQLPAPPADVRDGALFDLLHSTDYVVRQRYKIDVCLCEQLPLGLARQCGRSGVRLPAPSVGAPNFDAAVPDP